MADDNVEYRVGELERNYEKMDVKLEKILTNHLPHIQIEIAKLNTKMVVFSAIILTALGVLIKLGLS